MPCRIPRGAIYQRLQFAGAYQVYLQADAQFRANPEMVTCISLRPESNDSFQNLINQILHHWGVQQLLTSTCSGQLNSTVQAEGSSSGEAIKTMERLAAEVLPRVWAMNGRGLTRARSGGTAPIILVWEFIFVFLFWLPSTRITLTPLVFC